MKNACLHVPIYTGSLRITTKTPPQGTSDEKDAYNKKNLILPDLCQICFLQKAYFQMVKLANENLGSFSAIASKESVA